MFLILYRILNFATQLCIINHKGLWIAFDWRSGSTTDVGELHCPADLNVPYFLNDSHTDDFVNCLLSLLGISMTNFNFLTIWGVRVGTI